jgi:hypothetical protein
MSTIADGDDLRVVAGVDTHKDVHVAVVLDELGRLLDTASFPATARGYKNLTGWVTSLGEVLAIGVEIVSRVPDGQSSGSSAAAMSLNTSWSSPNSRSNSRPMHSAWSSGRLASVMASTTSPASASLLVHADTDSTTTPTSATTMP